MVGGLHMIRQWEGPGRGIRVKRGVTPAMLAPLRGFLTSQSVVYPLFPLACTVGQSFRRSSSAGEENLKPPGDRDFRNIQ